MTIIASFFYANSPILFGDILAITNTKYLDWLNLPSQGNNFKKIADYSTFGISGLVQKLTIITNDLVIASAGTIWGIKQVIGELKKLGKNPLSVKILKEFFKSSNINSITTTDVKLIAYYLNPPKSRMYRFYYHVNDYENEQMAQFRHLSYAGSGSPLFSEVIKDLDWIVPNLVPIFVDNEIKLINFKELFPELKSIYMTHHLLMEMTLFDYCSDFKAFKHKFGGGYEIIWYVENKFQIYDDYTIVIWRYYIDQGLHAISHIIKPSHVNNTFLMRFMDFEPEGLARDETHEIKPIIDYTIDSKKLDIKPEIGGRFLCNYIVLISNKNIIKEVKPRIIINPDNQSLIKLENQKLKVNSKLFSFIAQETLRKDEIS